MPCGKGPINRCIGRIATGIAMSGPLDANEFEFMTETFRQLFEVERVMTDRAQANNRRAAAGAFNGNRDAVGNDFLDAEAVHAVYLPSEWRDQFPVIKISLRVRVGKCRKFEVQAASRLGQT